MDPEEIDVEFRPITYFPHLDLWLTPPPSIKGAERRRLVQQAFEQGTEGEIPPELLQSAVPDWLRQFLGRMHPAMMGGEYLPDCAEDEVEIARITIASTTQDVTCVYAKRDGTSISYRVVDEYNGDTLDGDCTLSQRDPLTLGELADFFLSAWNLRSVLEYNFEDYGMEEDRVKGFIVDASSMFYPQFEELVFRRIDEWFGYPRPPDVEDQDEDEDEDDI